MAGSITFHMPSEAEPDKILPLLKVISDEQITFSSVRELLLFAKEQGLGDRTEMQIVAGAIGLLEREEQIELSEPGRTIGQLKSNIQPEVVHYLLYTTWQPSRPEENSFLWSYRQVVDSYWDRRTVDVIDMANTVAEEINNRTQRVFEGVEGYHFGDVSFSPKSIRGVRKWLEALLPPVIEDGIFTRRNFCPPELTLLAAGWVAQTMEGDIGIDFLITPPRREAICRVCLLEPNALDNALDWMLPTYPDVVQPGTSAGAYGRYLRFLKWPEITDLAGD